MTQTDKTQSDARLNAADIARWDDEGGASQAPKQQRIPKNPRYRRLVQTIDDEQEDS